MSRDINTSTIVICFISLIGGMRVKMLSTEERWNAHDDEELALLRKTEALANTIKKSKLQVPVEPHAASGLRDKTNKPNKEINHVQNHGEYNDNHL